ncbi:hypothetical protein TorRG33x02_276270 [Trema orientale]|uniref:Uncharacterized protein n=1 Tax=Trema orientale TaxID=63057 RepID=A0A2P5CQU7_TREOI|nr:hypothetical protein TorRG33x02_276270 [Trema orientale]
MFGTPTALSSRAAVEARLHSRKKVSVSNEMTGANDEAVEVGVNGSFDVDRSITDVVDGFVIEKHCPDVHTVIILVFPLYFYLSTPSPDDQVSLLQSALPLHHHFTTFSMANTPFFTTTSFILLMSKIGSPAELHLAETYWR